jgi:hypothetical protein
MNPEVLQELQSYLRIVHHVPGRIRIKFVASIKNHPKAKELVDKEKSLSGINKIRMNAAARSVVIEYDQKQIPPDLLQELLSTHNSERIQEIINELRLIE